MAAFLLFTAVLSHIGEAYPKYLAPVFAGNDLARSLFGAAFSLFANAIYARLWILWTSSLFGVLVERLYSDSVQLDPCIGIGKNIATMELYRSISKVSTAEEAKPESSNDVSNIGSLDED